MTQFHRSTEKVAIVRAVSGAVISARRRRTRDPVLAELSRAGTATRAELSRRTGLSRSAVGECVASLLAEGVIVEGPADGASAGRGRRATTLRLRAASGLVVGVDLGHTHIGTGVATREGEVLAERRVSQDVDHRPGRALDLAARLATDALAACDQDLDDVAAVAVGIPGPLDARTGAVLGQTILTDWVGIDPAAELADRLGRPVVACNDADMGAVGEQRFGAARGVTDFLYIKASHGIGAGLVLDGSVYRGATGLAGELGHVQVAGASELCRCGSRGCLETLASVGVVRRQLAHVLTTKSTPLTEDDLPPLAELADDSAAARVICDAGRTVGRAVADLVTCLNPAVIVVGGELGEAGAPFIDGIRESVDRHAQPASAQAVRIVSGQLGARAELLGTIATAQQRAASAAFG